jgi:hypothetical protein
MAGTMKMEIGNFRNYIKRWYPRQVYLCGEIRTTSRDGILAKFTCVGKLGTTSRDGILLFSPHM